MITIHWHQWPARDQDDENYAHHEEEYTGDVPDESAGRFNITGGRGQYALFDDGEFLGEFTSVAAAKAAARARPKSPYVYVPPPSRPHVEYPKHYRSEKKMLGRNVIRTMRYCGQLTIRITYGNSTYECYISAPDGGHKRIYVNTYEHSHASPEEFDEAASAAISFVAKEGSGLIDYADRTSSGWDIRRKRPVGGGPHANPLSSNTKTVLIGVGVVGVAALVYDLVWAAKMKVN